MEEIRPTSLSELAMKAKYKYEYVNGNIKFGPPLMHTNGTPPPDNEVYITGLPKTIDPMYIVNKFSQINKMYSFRIQKNNCFEKDVAFVHYLDVEDAKVAVKFYNDEELLPGGPRIKVFRAKYNKRLHVGYFDKTLSKEDIISFFMSKLENLSKVTIPEEEIKGNFKNPGFCSLLFKTGQDAEKAKKHLQMESSLNRLKLGNRDIRTIEFFNGFQEVVYNNRKCVCTKKPVQVIQTSGEASDVRLILTNFREDACVGLFKKLMDLYTNDYCFLKFSRQGTFVIFYFYNADEALVFSSKFKKYSDQFISDFCTETGPCNLIFPLSPEDFNSILTNTKTKPEKPRQSNKTIDMDKFLAKLSIK